ncbi:hypothetical protein OOT46_03895 [Aquabacterium sp. A7-Y]|uniref:hypothetical protein n=1 Tax=Aquabacterium sp. A7-Y TaxID=1349605 RepID=UPI00223DD8A8|nr:hypothetical protein [Aquabacterium sp. A7-Y]MCW7536996.1 hypothetical protein [Aquabacterium sp. A7-Y]
MRSAADTTFNIYRSNERLSRELEAQMNERTAEMFGPDVDPEQKEAAKAEFLQLKQRADLVNQAVELTAKLNVKTLHKVLDESR